MRSLAKLLLAIAAFAALLLVAKVVSAPYASIPQGQKPVTVLFAGDAMLDRGVARRAAALPRPEDLVAGMRELAHRADLVVLNLEGTITHNESIAQRDNTILRFTFAPALAEAVLAALSADAVSLANNHALDFYASGYDETRAHLDAWGIAHFGHPLNDRHLSAALSAGGFRLCLVGYHGLYDPDPASVVGEIARLAQEGACARIAVMPHWGVEYEQEPTQEQIALAHAFIDAGADLVVGAHPHVAQSRETYRGKAIFYSLGNFIFDQDFSPETRQGLLLWAEFGAGESRYTVLPVAIDGSRPVPGEALYSITLP